MGIGRSYSARLHGTLTDATNEGFTAGREGRFPGPALSLDRPIALYIVRGLPLERTTSCAGLVTWRSDPDRRPVRGLAWRASGRGTVERIPAVAGICDLPDG